MREDCRKPRSGFFPVRSVGRPSGNTVANQEVDVTGCEGFLLYGESGDQAGIRSQTKKLTYPSGWVFPVLRVGRPSGNTVANQEVDVTEGGPQENLYRYARRYVRVCVASARTFHVHVKPTWESVFALVLGYWEVGLKCSNTFITATYRRVEQCRWKVTYFQVLSSTGRTSLQFTTGPCSFSTALCVCVCVRVRVSVCAFGSAG